MSIINIVLGSFSFINGVNEMASYKPDAVYGFVAGMYFIAYGIIALVVLKQ